MMAGGDYVTVHLHRGSQDDHGVKRSKWEMVRRVRELELVSATTRKHVINNEPIKAGSQQADPAIFYAMSVLNRIMEVSGVHHSDHGLHAVLPDAAQQALADAFLAGSHAIDTDEHLRFWNTGWNDAPVRSADFSKVVRLYTGTTDTDGWTVGVGVTGDPHPEFGNGWHVVDVQRPYPTVWIYRIQR